MATSRAVSSGSFGSPNAAKQCTAMSKRSGNRCLGPAIVGSPTQKCRMHGGETGHAIGTRNPNFKDGRHSRYLPADLNSLYTEALANPELLEMADHIALLEAHMQDVLGRSASGDPVPMWEEMEEQFAEVETAILTGDMDRTIKQLEGMHKLLDAGKKWDRTWAQVAGTMEQLRKMTDTEVKRKKELNQMVPIERIMILMAAVGAAVKRNVSNPAEIEAVHRELAGLLTSNKTANGRVKIGPEVIDIPPAPTAIEGGQGGGQ